MLEGGAYDDPLATPDFFVLCLFKCRADCAEKAGDIIRSLESSIRDKGGTIQMRCDEPKNWHIVDGKDNFKEANHLSPAVFDVEAIVMGAFSTTELIHAWWTSEEVFEIMKWREPVEKMGVYVFDGLQTARDVTETTSLYCSDRFILLELLKMHAFKPVQHYVDCYKRFAERSMQEVGVECNLLFAEGVRAVLMDEFSLEAACASAWPMRQDMNVFYDSNVYQQELMPMRCDYATCLTMLVPINEDSRSQRASKAAGSTNRRLQRLVLAGVEEGS
eukprot:TRINITY_DN56948_c0_g1_i1.p1 TRINITY_DN56948_c0_g1~~TRINITY_DN56948_c0_g1_i1.p1  ORF type:complete len:275 (-),score=48.93 TRINITY_DN56948_c0_g1_i1:287-1111(-)